MSVESKIVEHYEAGKLLAAIEAGVEALGRTTSNVTIDDLGPVDEFHIGGRAATIALCERLRVGSGAQVLDVGCGIGGTARRLASTIGCQVTGVDLVAGYVDVARKLTDWTGLSDQISYEVGSALDLPLGESSFDAATLLHVGMNIEDKQQLFSEMRRVLRQDGVLGVYDVIRTAEGDLSFPVPWASDSSTSFVSDIPTYEAAFSAARFEISRGLQPWRVRARLLRDPQAKDRRTRGPAAPRAPRDHRISHPRQDREHGRRRCGWHRRACRDHQPGEVAP